MYKMTTQKQNITLLHELCPKQKLCNSQSTFVSVSTIKRPKGTSAERARGISMVNILNKCILSILVYNLFLDRQRNILYTPQYFNRYIGCLHKIEKKEEKRDGPKNRLDTMAFSCLHLLNLCLFVYSGIHFLLVHIFRQNYG